MINWSKKELIFPGIGSWIEITILLSQMGGWYDFHIKNCLIR